MLNVLVEFKLTLTMRVPRPSPAISAVSLVYWPMNAKLITSTKVSNNSPPMTGREFMPHSLAHCI